MHSFKFMFNFLNIHIGAIASKQRYNQVEFKQMKYHIDKIKFI